MIRDNFQSAAFLIFSSSVGIPKGRGTVGDMSPFLLTAVRRKQLLIVAGDVETNPGPGMNLLYIKFAHHPTCTYIVDVYTVDIYIL